MSDFAQRAESIINDALALCDEFETGSFERLWPALHEYEARMAEASKLVQGDFEETTSLLLDAELTTLFGTHAEMYAVSVHLEPARPITFEYVGEARKKLKDLLHKIKNSPRRFN